MAFYLTANIEIANKSFNFAHEVSIESSYNELTDRCSIILPTIGVIRQGETLQELNLSETFKVGDAVKVNLGYDNNNIQQFQGYIAEIKAKVPLELICEDEMWRLKRQQSPNLSFTGTLSDLIARIAPNVVIGSNFPIVQLKNFIIRNATVAEVLQKIKENYLLSIYFNKNKLFAGLAFTDSVRTSLPSGVFVFQGKRCNIVTNDLEFKSSDQVRLKAKAVSFINNNQKIETEVGDADGEQRTLTFRGITSVAALRTIAEQELSKLKFDGYRGSFETFGEPSVQHSQTIELSDEKYIERRGKYVVESVKKSWGVNGYRQNVQIGFKVSS